MKEASFFLAVATIFSVSSITSAWISTSSSSVFPRLRPPQNSCPSACSVIQHHKHSKIGLQANDNDEDDDDDFEDDDDEDDDDDIPSVDTSNFKPPSNMVSFGWNKGRSSPSQRKAMGTSKSGSTSAFVCTNCGCETVQWHGRCPTCKEWNTMQEFVMQREPSSSAGSNRALFSSSRRGAAASRPSSSWVDFGDAENRFMMGDNDSSLFFNQPVRITEVFGKDENANSRKNRMQQQRIQIPDDEELTNVLGGGIMKGSLLLLGGTPGVGKSTLLLQTAASVASLAARSSLNLEKRSGPVWYVSGEETAEQIASRAERLGLNEPELWLLSETHVDSLAEQVVTIMEAAAKNQSQILFKTQPPSLIMIDSIQTMMCDAGGNSAAGGVTQLRECVALFLRLAKSTGIPIILVGHVTKSGDVAGPRMVEHMVDCVLYMEGVGASGSSSDMMNLRMLRASKNRFGSSDEVGVYEMTAGRLLPVSDPSSLLMSHRQNTEDSEGCAITITLEGLRPMTVEIQALVTPSGAGPQGGPVKRTVNGIAYSRLSLLLGVLHKRCGMYFSKQDVYVNVVGQIRLDQSRGEGGTSDLAVAIALVSSLMSIPVRSDTAFVGEIGLLGELRPVAAQEKRLQEARRMGFSRVVTPLSHVKRKTGQGRQATADRAIMTNKQGVERIQCASLIDALNAGLVRELPKRRKRKPSDANGDSSSGRFQKAPGSLKDLDLEETIFDDYDEDGDSVFL